MPEARGLVLAKRLGIKTWALSHKGLERREFDLKLDAELREQDVELVALAGYMRLLSPEFVDAWEGRILNIHPSPAAAAQGPRHPPPGAHGRRRICRLLGPPRHRATSISGR